MEDEVPTEAETVSVDEDLAEVPEEVATARSMASGNEGIVWSPLEEQLQFLIDSAHMDEIYDILEYNADEDGASAAKEEEEFPAEAVAASDEEAAAEISEEVPARKVPTRVAAQNATAEDPAEVSQAVQAEPPDDETAEKVPSCMAEKVTTTKLDDEEKIPEENVEAQFADVSAEKEIEDLKKLVAELDAELESWPRRARDKDMCR